MAHASVCVSARAETRAHAAECFARLVRAVLGSSAVSPKKMGHGLSLVILGIRIALSSEGYHLTLDRAKALKCLAAIDAAIAAGGVMCEGTAQKLSGRLSWATQYLFYRLGRAMLRPFFQKGADRTVALQWWRAVLAHEISEHKLWDAPDSSCALLFVDARGSPARCAAVLLIDGQSFYTDGAPADEHVAHLNRRADNQITALEIMAIGVGLSTFADLLAGRKVLVFSDNTGAEVRASSCAAFSLIWRGAQAAARKGSCRAWDLGWMIHELWTLAVLNKIHLWIERVASDDNISDLPSRERYRLLESMGATWRPPMLARLLCEHCPVGCHGSREGA